MRLKAWIDRRRRKRRRRVAAKKHADSPLREFVYLDEISVYSLIASRLGPIAAEFTESQSASLRSEMSGSLKGGVPGVASSEVSSAVETQQSSGSQVVRKSIVQATFRELFDFERESLAMRVNDPNGEPPQISHVEELEALLSDGDQRWVLDAQALGRGDLIEIEVELEAEGIFRMGAIMTAIFEILEENPTLIDAEALGGLLEGMMANRMLDRLLVGLVPIRGRAVNYRHMTVGARELIVHKDLLRNLTEETTGQIRPLVVVGVAEGELFWRDIRRVLFSRSTYSMMCRVGRGGTHESWTPVKLVEVLKEVIPDLGIQIQSASEMLEHRDQIGESGSDEQSKRDAMERALVRYSIDLAAHYDKSLSAEELEGPSDAECEQYRTLEERRAAFGSATEAVAARFSLNVEPMVAAQLRMAALVDSGLNLDGELLSYADADVTPPHQVSSELRFLDTEIVAIYW